MIAGGGSTAEVTHGMGDGGPFADVRFDVVDVHDPRGAVGEGADLRRPGSGLALPRVILRRAFAHPGRPEPRHARPREERVGRVVALAEGEDFQTLRTRLEREFGARAGVQ